jgi:hypothetical protein
MIFDNYCNENEEDRIFLLVGGQECADDNDTENQFVET